MSVWLVEKSISHMKSKPKGIPKLNSNDVYLVLDQLHNCSVMGDRSYTYFKAYFWIGARSFNHHAKVENAISALDQVTAEHQG